MGRRFKLKNLKALILTTPKNIKELMTTQFARPEGKAGQFFTLAMNVFNFKLYNAVYNYVSKEDGARILDVGFGNGDTLKRLDEKLNAELYGVDISPDMKVAATKANAEAVAVGRMKLETASVEQMPYEDEFFDSVYTINTVYFWKEPEKALGEIMRVLRGGGRFLCGFYSRAYFDKYKNFRSDDEKNYTVGELRELVKQNGFENVKVKLVDGKKFMYCLVAEKRGNEVDNDSGDECGQLP